MFGQRFVGATIEEFCSKKIDQLTQRCALHFCYFRQAKQLKDYENAVIAKRLEELDDDEIQALVEEVEKDNF